MLNNCYQPTILKQIIKPEKYISLGNKKKEEEDLKEVIEKTMAMVITRCLSDQPNELLIGNEEGNVLHLVIGALSTQAFNGERLGEKVIFYKSLNCHLGPIEQIASYDKFHETTRFFWLSTSRNKN